MLHEVTLRKFINIHSQVEKSW